MIKQGLIAIADRIDDFLRSLLGRITPDGRVVIILIMLFLFSGLSIYMTVSSIYNMGKRSGRQMQIEHIKQVDTEHRQKADSVKQLNNFDYE